MITEKQEKDFNEWLESIRFVDRDGEILTPELKRDSDEGED